MIRLAFLKLPTSAPLPDNDLREMLTSIGIRIDPEENIATGWVREQHRLNNIPYVPGLIDIRICNEIESNPDVLRFIDTIGLELDQDEEIELIELQEPDNSDKGD